MTLQSRITAQVSFQRDKWLLNDVLPSVADALYRGVVILYERVENESIPPKLFYSESNSNIYRS